MSWMIYRLIVVNRNDSLITSIHWVLESGLISVLLV